MCERMLNQRFAPFRNLRTGLTRVPNMVLQSHPLKIKALGSWGLLLCFETSTVRSLKEQLHFGRETSVGLGMCGRQEQPEGLEVRHG